MQLSCVLTSSAMRPVQATHNLNTWRNIFTPKRLAITAGVLALNGLSQSIPLPNSGANINDSTKELTSYGLRTFGSIMLALFLENILPHPSLGAKGLKFAPTGVYKKAGWQGALRATFKPKFLRLAGALTLFNVVIEALHDKLGKKLDPGPKAGFDLATILAKLLGTFGLARMVGGGAGSLWGMIASYSCPCCGLTVCISELISAGQALIPLLSGATFKGPKPEATHLQSKDN